MAGEGAGQVPHTGETYALDALWYKELIHAFRLKPQTSL